MFPIRGALGLALLLMGTACDLGQPLGTGHPSPEHVVLQPADVPSDLHACPGSGTIDKYLQSLKAKVPNVYRPLEQAWSQLRSEGASGAAVAVFGASASTCTAELGAGPGRNAASLVAAFGDRRAAASAYDRGILGFPTPAPGQQVPDLLQGVATGLSEHAWLVQRLVDGRTLYVAWWQDQVFDVFFVSVDLDATESQRAAAAVEHRLR